MNKLIDIYGKENALFLIKEFVLELKNKKILFLKYQHENEWNNMKSLFHNIKSASGSLYLTELSEFSKKMQEYILNNRICLVKENFNIYLNLINITINNCEDFLIKYEYKS